MADKISKSQLPFWGFREDSLIRYAFDEIFDQKLENEIGQEIEKNKQLKEYIENIKIFSEKESITSPEEYIRISNEQSYNF